jgi:predicted amino acid dehydrogenase
LVVDEYDRCATRRLETGAVEVAKAGTEIVNANIDAPTAIKRWLPLRLGFLMLIIRSPNASGQADRKEQQSQCHNEALIFRPFF